MSVWRANASLVSKKNGKNEEADDWETDPDFVVSILSRASRFVPHFNLFFVQQNDVSEEEQRWGSKTVVGSGRTVGAIE